MLRIISGKARGTRLAGFQEGNIKPTSGRTKEALFSIIFSKGINGAFLDLFSGSGQIGLEAASRGFSPVVLVEKSKKAQIIIRENIRRTKMSANLRLLDLAERIFYQLQEQLAQIMMPDGLLILEHEIKVEAPDAVTVLEHLQSCNYGSAMLSFYKRK